MPESLLRLEFFQILGGAGASLMGFTSDTDEISVPAQPLSGLVAISVSPRPLRNVRYVSMFIDNQLLAADPTYPYAFAWDTRTVADGAHTLRADAVYRNHTRSEVLVVQVSNGSVTIYPSTTLYPSETLPFV